MCEESGGISPFNQKQDLLGEEKYALLGFFFFLSKLRLSGSVYNKSFVSFSVVFLFRIKATHITAGPEFTHCRLISSLLSSQQLLMSQIGSFEVRGRDKSSTTPELYRNQKTSETTISASNLVQEPLLEAVEVIPDK